MQPILRIPCRGRPLKRAALCVMVLWTTSVGAQGGQTQDLIDSAGFFSTKSIDYRGTYRGPTPGVNPIGWRGPITGSTSTGTFSAIDFAVTQDTFANTSVNSLVNAVNISHNFGGAAFRGGAQGLEVNLTNDGGATGNSDGMYGVAGFTGYLDFNDGGTAANPRGALFGINPNVRLQCNSGNSGVQPCATNFSQIVGEEIDIGIYQGASAQDRIGMQIVDDVPPANLPDSQGSRSDLAFSFNSRVPAAAHWDMGLAFGAFAGYWPMASTGTMIGCWPHATMRPATARECGTTAFGIDFAGLGGGGAVTFTGAAFASPGFKVDGAGNTSVAELTTSSGIKSAGAVFAAPTLTACRGTGSPIGGAVAGSVTITTGGSACTVKFHELPVAPHGWICTVFDQTQAALLPQSANDTTSCTVRGNIASGDTLVFHAAVSY